MTSFPPQSLRLLPSCLLTDIMVVQTDMILHPDNLSTGNFFFFVSHPTADIYVKSLSNQTLCLVLFLWL